MHNRVRNRSSTSSGESTERRPTRRSVLTAAAISLPATTGCTTLTGPETVDGAWPTRGYGASRTGHRDDGVGPAPPLQVLWTADLPGVGGATAPVVADGTVYVGDVRRAEPDEQYVAAHDAASGERLWRTTVATFPSVEYPGYQDAISVGEYVYVQTHEGLTALTTDGTVAWTADDTDPAEQATVDTAQPAVGDEAVYVGSYGFSRNPNRANGLTAIDPRDGSELWTATLSDHRAGGTVSPAYADGVVVTAYRLHGLFATDAATGEVLWRRDVPATSPPTIGDGRVFVTVASDVRHDLLVLDADTGEPLWRDRAGGGESRGIAVDGDQVYYAGDRWTSAGTRLYARDVDSGNLSWRTPDAGYTPGTPAVVGDRVYAVDAEGSLRILDRDTGEPLGAAGGEADPFDAYSPAVVDDIAYFTGPDTVYAAATCERSLGSYCVDWG